MRLIDFGDGEAAEHLLVHLAALLLVLGIEGTAVLVDHDARIVERLEAAAVELLGEQPLRGPERIGGIVDDEVVLPHLAAQKLQPVLNVQVDALIGESRRRLRKESARDVDEHFVLLHDVDALDLGIAAQFLGDAAVAAADDQHVADMRVYRHGDVRHHLVIDELVLFRKDDLSV